MNRILIIGTLPPCPRCGLLTKVIDKKAELLGLDAEIRHIAYTSEEAKEIAGAVGLDPGTAKEVAKKAGKDLDLTELFNMRFENTAIEGIEPDLKEFEKLFRKVAILDKRLRPYENMAQDVGILMTPVLLINGEIKHQGSVPSVAEIEEWLAELTKSH